MKATVDLTTNTYINMKRNLLLFVSTLLLCMSALGATVQRTILSHKGQITQYDANHWQEAISNAVAGDTVYFTSGNFSGALTIDKPITIIGAGISEDDAFYKDTSVAAAYEGCATTGGSTTIEGDINIAIPGSVTLTKSLLENVRLSGYSIYFSEPVTNPIIKRCQVSMIYTNWWTGGTLSASAKVTNLTLKDCYIWNVSFENFENPDIQNCYFEKIEPTPEETVFTNCTILDVWNTSNCTFVNCIVHLFNGSNNTCVNCIYDNMGSGDHTTFVDSWYVDGAAGFTKSQLQAGNFIGTDGTVVGPLGGPAPFTFIPSLPYVSYSSLTYIKSTKKLNVNVTVKQGK